LIKLPFFAGATAGEEYFVSKTAAAVLSFLALLLFSVPMSAQFNGLLPNGNVYAGVSYGQLTNVVNKQSYRGWNGSFEALPFTRFPHLGVVVDASGFYRPTGVTQYNFVAGPRLSTNLGRWRPFVQAMAGIRHLTSSGFVYNPIVIDVGGGADYKLFIKNFSWRLQGDYMHTRYASATQNDYRVSTGIVWRF
jgi:hypothetical protein